MWQQLSGSEKFRFVCFVIGLPASVVGAILTAMAGQWFNAAVQTFLGVSFAYYLHKFATRGRGMGEPQPHTINPGTRLAMAALASSTAPTEFDPATSPTLPTPSSGPPMDDPKSRTRRRIALAGGAAVIATIIVVLAVVFTNGSERANRPPASPTKTAPANTVPFTGVYRADFGPSATNGKPDQGATPSTGQWAVRSACPAAGCVATATATGGPTLQSAFVFDDIGGQWHAVSAASVASPPPGVSGFHGCTFPAEYWTFITLQPRPDGTLAGQYRARNFAAENCTTERTVTFTRIGDVDLNSLPDPASQPVRVASPAEAFHGRYRFTETPDGKVNPRSWNAIVETDCLRTGERCISFAHGDKETTDLVFADGKWTLNFDGVGLCAGGGSNPTKVYWELPLPQPPQDPITLLTGHGYKDVTGDGKCAGSYDESVKFERGEGARGLVWVVVIGIPVAILLVCVLIVVVVRIVRRRRASDAPKTRAQGKSPSASDVPAQGPGWWQASDGNWYPPQEQLGYAPPPPPGYAAPAGQTLGNATAASTVGAAKFPVAAWLLLAGCAVFVIASFLPARASSTASISTGHVFGNLVADAVCGALVWATFARPRPRLWSLITLTVITAVEVFGWIVLVLGLAYLSASPGAGVFVSGAAIGFLVAGVIMAWIARSKARP
jgi:hypothetical protein